MRIQLFILIGLIGLAGCRSDKSSDAGSRDEPVADGNDKPSHGGDRDGLVARLEALGFDSRIDNDEVLASQFDRDFSVIARFDSTGAKEYVFQFRPNGSEDDLMKANEVIALLANRMDVGPGVVWLVVNSSVRNQSKLEAVRDRDVMIRSHFLDPLVMLSLTRVND